MAQRVMTSTSLWLQVIDGVIDGINATVFAYGATGTGKTHTMIGNSEHAGITVCSSLHA